MFLKFAAIFFEFFDPNSLPFKLWLVSKEFTLIAFSQNVSKEDCEEMNVLSNIMIHFIKELGGHIFCKLHHITHYGQLIKQFGPLYFYSTFRYERKHQYCKHIARLMRNFINPSKTIHSRHQLRRAIIERNILFYSTNYFSTITKIYNYEPNFQKITPLELNQNYECLLPSERPFPLNKNVLRRCLSTSAAHIFIHATQFYKNINTGQVLCYGHRYTNILVAKLRKSIRSKPRSEDLYRKDGLKVLSLNKGKCFVPLQDICPINDFLFIHYQNKIKRYFLIECLK